MRLALVDGSPEQQISPWDRGFLYGEGVFETLRVYRGRPFALEAHLAMLGHTARALAFERVDEALGALAADARRLTQQAGEREGVLRLLLTRRLDGAPLRAALLEPFTPLPDELYLRGAAVETGGHPGGALGPKTMSYLGPMEALRQARLRGVHEVLWRDEAGGLGQGCTCNLLWAGRGRLLAPAPARGRAGVTRGWLVELARGEGFAVEARPIYPADLAEEGELLLCSTLREVLAVASIDGRPVGPGEPGPLGRRWRESLQRAAVAECRGA